MARRSEREKLKLQEKYQQILTQMLKEEDNRYCVDCDAKHPGWASWNIGVFICIRCAGFHRKLGVHISKVKSVNLDSWTKEQIAGMQAMGNSRARAVYEANLPDGFRRPQTDSGLEPFIRAKYEQHKWIAKEWIPAEITIAMMDRIESENSPRNNEINSPKIEHRENPLPTPIIENLLDLDEPVIAESNQLDPLEELFASTNLRQTEKLVEDEFSNVVSSSSTTPVMSKESILALFNASQRSNSFNHLSQPFKSFSFVNSKSNQSNFR